MRHAQRPGAILCEPERRHHAWQGRPGAIVRIAAMKVGGGSMLVLALSTPCLGGCGAVAPEAKAPVSVDLREPASPAMAPSPDGMPSQDCSSSSSRSRARKLIVQIVAKKEQAIQARKLAEQGEPIKASAQLRTVKAYLSVSPDVTETTARKQLGEAKDLCVEDHKDVLDAIAAAESEAVAAEHEVEEAKDTCQSGAHCLYVGAYAVNASFAWATLDTQHGGSAGHALVAAALPVAGYRYAIWKDYLWLDIGLGSMLASKDLSAEESRTGCRVTGDHRFEDTLPCQANASLSPLVFFYPALTLGKSDVGLLTVMPLIGAATTSLDNGVYPFFALSVGTLSYSKSFVWKAAGE